MNCQDVEPLLTPYVDDEATAAERERVAAHLAECRPCAARAAKEHAARRLIQVRSRALAAPAPAALRARCAALATSARPVGWFGFAGRLRTPARAGVNERRPAWLSWRTAGLAGATASIILTAVVGYGALTHSSTLLVAGLTLDHLKCFALHDGQATPADARSVEATLERNYGWHVKVPAGLAAQALTLVGARRCLSSDGTTAHVMYRHGGNALSLYVLPEGVAHAASTTSFAGHPATVWSHDSRTYVLIGNESDAGMRPV
ncbi:MAG: zf-HC2 domain-containing protein, partial [Bacteroidales bacterium]